MEKDLRKKGYFYDPERFADLINGVMCSGRQIVLPADLTELDSQTGQFDASAGQKKHQKKLKDRQRDLMLCEVRKFENTDVFRTDLKQVFDCIRYSDDPEKLYELVANDPSYREMNGDTYELIAHHTKTNELMQVKTHREGKVDMCKAITELINRGREEGRQEGRQEGIEQGLRDGAHAFIKASVDRGAASDYILEMVQQCFGFSKEKADALYMECKI